MQVGWSTGSALPRSAGHQFPTRKWLRSRRCSTQPLPAMGVGEPLTGGSPNQKDARIESIEERHVRSIVSAETGPALTSRTALSPPACSEPALMPTDHGFRLDDDQRLPPALPEPAQKNADHAVAVLQSRTLLAAAQHFELVVEGDVFEGHCLARTKRPSDEV